MPFFNQSVILVFSRSTFFMLRSFSVFGVVILMSVNTRFMLQKHEYGFNELKIVSS
jgi:hypothetical protein